VERFLDTPVKRYSSGMYVRLAFAVAAHLEPEILIVDEVLAVGDAQFQKKCLGKMEDVSKEGRTIIFVSHNITTISRLCNSAILLNYGQVKDIGLVTHVLKSYQNLFLKATSSQSGNQIFIVKNEQFSLEDITITPNPVVILGELNVKAIFSTKILDIRNEYSVFFCFVDTNKNYYSSMYSRDESLFYVFDESYELKINCKLNSHSFLPGKLRVEAGIFDKFGECQFWVDTGYDIEISEEMFNGGFFDGRGGYATTRGTWCNKSQKENLAQDNFENVK
jgi:lipopolysaccharide transport system ATP-binding protein